MNPVRVLLPVMAMVVATRTVADCTAWVRFASPVRIPSSAVQAVLIHDLDGDGAPEIIASGNQVDQQGALSIFRNRGDGTFAAEQFVPTPIGEKLEDIADLDGDTIPDLLVSNYWANGIATYRGRKDLSFDPESPHATATHGGPSRIVDYDHDGVPDLISVSFGSGNPVRVHLFRGHGDGTFESKKTLDTSLANGASLSTRSIDGSLDLLVSERSGNLGLLRIENGILAGVSRLPAGPGFDLSSTFADVNGDGIEDIIDTNDDESGATEPVFVTLAGAGGTFRERKRLDLPRTLTLPVEVEAADVDGDGRTDLLVSDFRQPALNLYRGDGTGNFDRPLMIDAGGAVNAFAISDVDGDGRPDLVTVNDGGTMSVILNRGSCQPARRRAVSH